MDEINCEINMMTMHEALSGCCWRCGRCQLTVMRKDLRYMSLLVENNNNLGVQRLENI